MPSADVFVTSGSAAARPNGPESPAFAGEPDRLYWLGECGFLYVAQSPVVEETSRGPAVLLLSVCGNSFTLEHSGRAQRLQAAAVASRVHRSLDATGVALVSAHVTPCHELFRDFNLGIPNATWGLARASFAHLDDELNALRRAELSAHGVRALFEGLIRTSVDNLPTRPVPDLRAQQLTAALRQDPDMSLESLANLLDLSPARLPHVFQRSLGVSLYGYQAWRRTRAAATYAMSHPNDTLASAAHHAGFTDSAHMGNVWKRSYGQTPGRLRLARSLQVVRCDQSDTSAGR